MALQITNGEAPEVTLAVQHLSELGTRMTTDDFGFQKEDILNIDKIIECLETLDGERIRAHEMLETETIKASALRYKLMNYPIQINNEIQRAVKAARSLNAATLNKLQAQLQHILDTIKSLEDQYMEYEKENEVLLPHRDTIHLKHEEVVARLNERLAQKAGKQIDLNELRNKLREANRRIVSLTDDIVMLKEDMVLERATAREQKRVLSNETNDTNKEKDKQLQVNAVKQTELTALKNLLSENEQKLADIAATVEKRNTKSQQLEDEAVRLSDILDGKIAANNALRKHGEELVAEQESITAAHNAFVQRIASKNNEVEKEIAKQQRRKKVLDTKNASLTKELTEAMRIREEDAMRVKALNDRLQGAKGELATKAEETGQLQQEMHNMQERMASIAEAHKSTVVMLNKHIAELRDQLGKERKERILTQQDKDKLQLEIDEFRSKTAKFMKDINQKITGGKAEHTSLTSEELKLTTEMKEYAADSQRLTQELSVATDAYNARKSLLTERIATLEREIAEMEAGIVDRTGEIDDQMPDFLELEDYYNRHTKEYDNLKRELAAFKNKKMRLEEISSRTSNDIEKSDAQIVELRSDLDQKHEALKTQLKKHAEKQTILERNIYVTGCKLESVVKENDRFTWGIDKHRATVEAAEDGAVIEGGRVTGLEAELREQAAAMETGWLEHDTLSREFQALDQQLMREVDGLLARTVDREAVSASVCQRLQDQLQVLADFLEQIGGKRPRDTGPAIEETALQRAVNRVVAMNEAITTIAKLNQPT